MGTCLSAILPRRSRVLGTFRRASPNGSAHLPLADDTVDKKDGPAMRRRALLVGITYSNAKTWSELDGPHDDVDRYQKLLLSVYGYRPEDIVVLKDLQEFPEHSRPTRVNMLRELKALVAGAEPGDRFTFFYSGHSDQQDATSDVGEEDDMDEMIITSDELSIIDNELKEILVLPLPVGCSLLAILDTCHSGTMLDLPHYHCNSVYVPWQSKGERRTMTMRNINVRRQATDIANSTRVTSIETALEGQRSADQASGQPLQVDTQTGESQPAAQMSPGGQSRGTRRPRERMLFSNQTRYASPEARFVCDGWCKHSEDLHPNILSLSACSDLQRAWEGPNGSLTTVLCNYLKDHNYPSYGALMSHINFQLHDNALALHDYTRDQRKKASHGEGDGFDGELDNFQEPELSSLVRLNMDDTLQL
ncbi:caspase domain-containing protein [Russula earlei]|uniref:Caspase domain-containing protein n=1 Tax=Russula earlei TaxID=71964 RepID=A0ACC0UH74_9AGAM|nr:caspase domain-containing protein [Russula earlei]